MKVTIIGNVNFVLLLYPHKSVRFRRFAAIAPPKPPPHRTNYFNKLTASKTIRNNRVMPDETFHLLLIISSEVCDV